jgi:hypothetical protein
MLGPDYWNAGTSLLFGVGFQASVSTRCSPTMSYCTSSCTASPPNSTWYHAEAGYREWESCLHFARVFLAPSFYKHKPLQSGGRRHAHGMVGSLLCSLIAQQRSVLVSFSFTVLFIAGAEPWAVDEVMTLSQRDPGTCRHVHN